MEKFVLGSMMLRDGEIIPAVSEILDVEDFSRAKHRVIYEALLKLYNSGVKPNFLILANELRSQGKLESGDLELIFSLPEVGYTTAYSVSYARVLKEKSQLRRLVEIGAGLQEEALSGRKEVEEILGSIEEQIYSVRGSERRYELEELKPILLRAFEEVQHSMDRPGELAGVPSGYIDLDRVTGGFQKSNLIILAARPAMGKTALALNIAVNAGKRGKSVAIFSTEMNRVELGKRILFAEAGVEAQKLKTGSLDSDEYAELVEAIEGLSELKIGIDDKGGVTVPEVRSKARRLAKEQGLDLIIVDYLQLMSGHEKRYTDSNRVQEVSEISRNLKSLAKELEVPVLALSQLSRSPELRADKRPMLSDLRDSGALEQDADIVLFLYRDEYYQKSVENEGLAELIIAKNRHGPVKTIQLQFDAAATKFNSLAGWED